MKTRSQRHREQFRGAGSLRKLGRETAGELPLPQHLRAKVVHGAGAVGDGGVDGRYEASVESLQEVRVRRAGVLEGRRLGRGRPQRVSWLCRLW